MRIGELARRTAVSERSLRYYEKQGLLTAERTRGGHREYGQDAVDRVIRIQQLFAAGFCSSKIAQLLGCIREHGGTAVASPELVRDLMGQRDRINLMIRDLLRSRDVLDEVISEAVPEGCLP
ncbi:MerR family transcriptional regulator [Goodfellowiella coeruleoviolacea]|uniref:DNA-binding transcriptional regulator, MerR family n=1 Tax=Goodfellowiella coeruleoviolacea TaxID=334858 RepID=A0AAE3G959_9PSEU|nr:MerR family transcriptional regulator [Goodfellowiella coeruleoviolacea]MCP2163855.1 DNA-binding transcriptional regulator, MerR family [Goodfellowiella coeruleoviolacea]